MRGLRRAAARPRSEPGPRVQQGIDRVGREQARVAKAYGGPGTGAGEDVDGLALLPDGSLLISPVGGFAVPGLSGSDEDVIRFTGTFGSATAGSYSMYFDGGDVGFSYDVDGIAGDGVDMYFSAVDAFSAGGVSAQDEDIVAFTGSFGPATSGTYRLFWDGSANGTTQDVGGIDLA